jgi:predicted O-linked N-acetylglucosamine transferase (SPINDLY family)
MSFERAITIDPGHSDAMINMGVALHELGRVIDAIAIYDRALKLVPTHVVALLNRGVASKALRQLDSALTYFDRALKLAPDDPILWHNRADVLFFMDRFEEAKAGYDRALLIDAKLTEAWLGLTNVFMRTGRVAEALNACQRAIDLKPKAPNALLMMGQCHALKGDAETAIQFFDRSLAIRPADEVALFNRIFSLDFCDYADFATHQEARADWWRQIGRAIYTSCQWQHKNVRDPNRRIVLGYVSAEFRKRSAASNFLPVIENHDKTRFEVICYSGVPAEDEVTAFFRNLADQWRDVSQWSDQELGQHIRADRVDILIDLSGPSEHNRLRTFASKPAPIQVTAWGHATGTGQPTIDYLFSDPVLIPTDVRHLFAEQIYDLPCVIIIQPPPDEFRSLEPPVISNGYLTYGVFNRISKISNAAIGVWAQILKSDPAARLVIKDHALSEAFIKDALLDRFALHGITPERLDLIGGTLRAEHMKVYGLVDICLDPFPHCGGVSTWEALYMGVPVVTRLGNSITKRLGGAILSAIGMTDWIANDNDQYIDIAMKANPDQLRMLRRILPDMINTRCGPVAYTRSVEQAYQAMWTKYCTE